MRLTICPECEQGKHPNCTEDVLIEDVVTLTGLSEEWVPCECPTCNSREDPANPAVRAEYGVGGGPT